MHKYLVPILLSVFIGISIVLHFFRLGQIPPCVNADEAAFGYNAYSILKTGRDEYGAMFPLRLKSFEDYKLPIYTYLSIPIIAVFGLSDFSTRFLNVIIGVSFVPLMYLLVMQLFGKRKIGLLAAFLTAVNPGIFILSRHAHEGVISTFFVLVGFLFLLKYVSKKRLVHFFLTNLFMVFAAYAYQTGRIYLGFFFLVQLIILIFQKIKDKTRLEKYHFFILIAALAISFYPDFRYGVNRVKNLFFLKDSGFHLRLGEYLGEHNVRFFHNKATEAVREVTNRYLFQLSPEFFISNGDKNWRFGFPNLGLFTPVEYFFLFTGLYFLFKNKERYRYLLLALFFITPFNNALTWQDPSLIRSYLIIFPFILIVSYGFWHLFDEIKKKRILLLLFIVTVSLVFLFFLSNNLDLYFFHYPKRAMTIRAWQCGYKELVDYVRINYDDYDRFVITDRHGQPYIFFLYYLEIDPKKYQEQAKISGPDTYGFGQVERFDKFDFKFSFDPAIRKTVYIGYPEAFNDEKINKDRIKKIKVGTEEIFWIYEVN